MADTYEKVDDNTLKVVFEKQENHNYNMLLKKKALYEAELAKVNRLIAEADKLGIVQKV